jgi:hypothetical protein
MRKALLILSFSILLLTLFFLLLHARESKKESYVPKVDSPAIHHSARHLAQRTQTSSAYIDTFVLAEYTFDSMGAPDPQGWYGVDKTVQDTIFHVNDFAGLSGGYGPLEGVQSVWCGAKPDPVYCNYATLPGYCNSWDQWFESVSFTSSGDVTLNCLVKYDSEADYDYTYLEYLHKNGYWVRIDSVHGQGEKLWSGVAPADSLNHEVKFRFRFSSDGAWSDEDGLYNSDGAVILDSITVSDTLGVLDYQDFEGESVGDQITSDGDWVATAHALFRSERLAGGHRLDQSYIFMGFLQRITR